MFERKSDFTITDNTVMFRFRELACCKTAFKTIGRPIIPFRKVLDGIL
ncbi:MAG: hypothetical protein JO327_08760 [Nitrososphaeraceae archaeon]|nr:hypothetical protein [Nitrososphaeraceae archaeon]